MNDRDEEHYEHEESEYHFSDDDVSYEVETEASKPTAPLPERKNPLAGLTQSKRMLISVVVFLGLVFVVYKMVSPGSTVPSTEITPVAMTPPVTQEIAPPPLPHTTTAEAPAPTAVAPTQAEATPPAQPVAPAQPEVAPTQVAVAPTAVPPAPATTPATIPVTTTSTAVTTPAQPVAVAPQTAQPAVTSQPPQPIAQTAPPPPVATAPATQAAAIPPAPLATPAATAPAAAMAPAPAAPVQVAPTTIPSTAPAQQPLPVATTVVTTPTVTPANTDANIAAMAATNEKLMNQLQSEYSQKVTDFSNQNRALQDQMQTLNSRVAGLESQLNQLVQTLSRQTGMGGTTSLNVVPAQQPPPPPIPPIVVEQPRIRYNVQAIIPGRAWLKSDNGETLTVAEGDSIRELGRVTKIDPYDGVVEVNTGSRTVSISYGSG